jgi:hypothetical protein
MSHKNGHSRDQEAAVLYAKLDSVKQLIRDGVDVWRNRQRERYLEVRLREIKQSDTQRGKF